MPDKAFQFLDYDFPAPGVLTAGGLRFNTSLTDFTQKTTRDEIVLLKSQGMLDYYKELFSGKPIRSILEFGTWEGGSPLFLAAATNARKVVGIDIRDPSDEILHHAAKFGDRLKLVYNTSQADRQAVSAVVDREMAGVIDVVIDDASHQYELTKAAFEIAFPKLRVGGYYIIEDWNWAHYEDPTYDDYWADQPALSNLALELALAVGSHSAISAMKVTNWSLIIEKGGDVAADFRLDDMIRMGKRRCYTRY